MILVDSVIWVDHIRQELPRLSRLLDNSETLCHPFVVGEIALGSLRDRQFVLESLSSLPQAPLADHEEVLFLLEERRLFSLGIGYVDLHLVASCLLLPGTLLWTRDRRLDAAAHYLGIDYLRDG
ncbi:VapC toxin family PIN domain ribonuclease [Aquibium sp. ELW1220]|uniref:type II toxin-antitoxin system VapC family toxin n=1 Tax=Aquibium sp. ELW1220 TaxID=2976766 RepID=UPI0025AFE460|nr:VapC toxin family PIN domain ribonuclease [Aquibium sp. ELW1220]MDN2579402.1 VapC toxin family PIN domain ribonuclease [Aquibium sp. ELW1220]